MITENSVVKQKLQTVNTTVPSVSAALNKGGAVSLVFATVHARPKETCESPYEETETETEVCLTILFRIQMITLDELHLRELHG